MKWPALALGPKADPRHLPALARDPSRIDPTLRALIRKASMGGVKWPIYVSGQPGTGKTCAGLCVADHSPGSEFWPFDQFATAVNEVKFGRLVTTIQGKDSGEGWREPSLEVKWTTPKWWAWIERLSLVVIDDVGLRDRANESQYEAMKGMLDRRTNKPLIVTSNLAVDDLAKIFDARVWDRLSSGTVLELAGNSMR